MQKINIKLSTIEKVKSFCRVAEKCEADVDVCYGRYTVDGKSIMGIFSMDLTKTLELRIHSDDVEIAKMFEEYFE